MTENEFEQLCKSYGFDSVAATLWRHALPCVGFSLGSERCDSPAVSRLGGVPAVPKSFEWPLYRGRPLDFLLQINLEEAHAHDSTGVLPPKGLLAFFYAVEEQPWGFDHKDLSFFRVCYFEDDIHLSARSRPHHRLNAAELPERRIQLWPAISVPTYGSRAWSRLSKLIKTPGHEFDFAAFAELSEALFRAAAPTPTGPRHHLLGHSNNIQNDMQLEAQLVTNGLYCGDASGYKDPRRPELEKDREEWRLLLQLDSDDSAQLMWGDEGMLYFWVRQSELARRDFSNAWMALQCG